MIIDLHRCSLLHDAGIVHNYNGICHGKCFFLIVGNHDGGDAQLLLQSPDLFSYFLSDLGIQGR